MKHLLLPCLVLFLASCSGGKKEDPTAAADWLATLSPEQLATIAALVEALEAP